MKVGILTFHDTTNFGAVLQAVATYKVIAEMGYDTEIIDYHCQSIDAREVPGTKYDIGKGNLKGFISYILNNKKYLTKHKNLMSFLNNEAKISKKKYGREDISIADSDYDIFVAGSDMLWCTKFTGSDYTYMLDFVNGGKRKNAFATSVGYDWDESEVEKISKLLKSFHMIAVREANTARRLTELLNRKIYHVCDPTMLVAPEQWRKFIETGESHNTYCLIYMDDLQGNCEKAAKEYASKHRMKIYYCGLKNIRTILCGKNIIHADKVSDFLGVIAGSEMLFTASYHGMLFAIYFHIPFVYFNKDSYRLEGVADKLGLKARDGNKYHVNEMDEINWEKVDEKRTEFAGYSKDILRQILEISECKK